MTSRVSLPILADLEQNDKPMVKEVLKGIKQIQHQQIPSQSHSLTQTSFSFQPPSQNTVIDRRFDLEFPVQFTAGNAGFVGSDQQVLSSDRTLNDGTADTTQSFGFRTSVNRMPIAPTQDTSLVGASAIANASTPAGTTEAEIQVAIQATVVAINAEIAKFNAVGTSTLINVQESCGTVSAEIKVGNNLSPRQFPLANCMESIDLVINGTHFSVSVNQYIHALMSYTSPEWREKHFSDCAHAPDVSPNYAESIGTNRNAMALEGENFRRGESPRGSVMNAVLGNTANTFSLTFREPLFISPLMCMLGYGLTNINQLDITIRWSTNAQAKLLSYLPISNIISQVRVFDPANPTTNKQYARPFNGMTVPTSVGITAQFTGGASAALLNVNYYTPQDDVNIPNEIILPYKQPQIELFTVGAGPALNANATVNSNNIRLNQIPESCYIYIAQRHSSKTISNSDVYARLLNVSVDWKNQTSILNGYDERSLCQMAIKNGYDRSVSEVVGRVAVANVAGAGGFIEGSSATGCGLVLKLNFGEDIPLDDNESPGTRGDYNWRVAVRFNSDACNLPEGAVAKDLVLHQIFVLNGHAIVSPNECRVSTGVLSIEDNMNASDMGHEYQSNMNVVGGSMVGGSEVGGSLIGGKVKHLKRVVAMGHHLAKAGKASAPHLRDAVDEYRSRA